MNTEIELVEECPECKSKEILYTNWIDNEIVSVTYVCQECHFTWREKFDLGV